MEKLAHDKQRRGVCNIRAEMYGFFMKKKHWPLHSWRINECVQEGQNVIIWLRNAIHKMCQPADTGQQNRKKGVEKTL